MIVNVNPYDTGYDENTHVMKFSAVAREVAAPAPATLPKPRSKSSFPPVTGVTVVPHRRKVTISTGRPGSLVSETHLEVLEGLFWVCAFGRGADVF